MRLGLAVIFIFISSLLAAQPGGGGPGGGGDPDVPLGGIELLIAAGALFGAKKAFDKKKSK
ncbi:MAG: hypothetical protein L3J06_00425 [Cyclobacteriaceae bacterium]|nr:hypothetical protein [Cyclobacteriaceae bacterium]